MRNACFGFLSLVAICVLAGCSQDGPEIAPATGVVNYEGKPLEGARVMFHPKGEGARSSHGTTDAQGKFSLSTFGMNDGATVTQHVVTISKAELPGDAGEVDVEALKREGYAGGGMKGYEGMMGVGKAKKINPIDQIPEKYKDRGTSGIEVEVTSDGPNEFTFNLE